MKKKKREDDEEIVKIEKISKKERSVSEEFYYIMGFIVGLVLIFATEELLDSINYLFVIIFGIMVIIQLLSFVFKKEYEKGQYVNLVGGIISIWLAIFIYKYGDFIFLEMLPVLASFLLFVIGTSSLTKYFDRKKIGNLIITFLSLILGLVLLFIPRDAMFTLFKITGIYMIVLIALDFINYLKIKS